MNRGAFLVVALLTCTAGGCQGKKAEPQPQPRNQDVPIGPGTVLTAHNEAGERMTLRIDAVEKDPQDPDGDVYLYTTSFQDGAGAWKPLCLPDREGRTYAIPVQGTWDAQRNHVAASELITFACTNGAIAKCVRYGYKPWKTVNGTALADYHQACVHVIPADYCGDGRADTRDGTAIQIYDRLGVRKPEARSGLAFEAAWSQRGAAYVAKPRWGGETLGELVGQCPKKLRGHTALDAPSVSPQLILDRSPEVLLITESAVTTERP